MTTPENTAPNAAVRVDVGDAFQVILKRLRSFALAIDERDNSLSPYAPAPDGVEGHYQIGLVSKKVRDALPALAQRAGIELHIVENVSDGRETGPYLSIPGKTLTTGKLQAFERAIGEETVRLKGEAFEPKMLTQQVAQNFDGIDWDDPLALLAGLIENSRSFRNHEKKALQQKITAMQRSRACE